MSEDKVNYGVNFRPDPIRTLSPELEAQLREKARQHRAAAEADARTRPARFLAAWKRGVLLAGPRYFNATAESVQAATHKNQLRPDFALIDSAIGGISRGEGAFLAAMYSFFNSEDGQVLLKAAGFPNICDLAAKLDKDQAEVIAELFVSYHGW